MYVSRAVRSLEAHPVPEATVTLLLEVEAPAEIDRVRQALRAMENAEVLAEHRFDTLRVRVPQDRLASVCAIDGLAAVETADTLAIDPDGAGEDVGY